jgi:hypothetical protein
MVASHISIKWANKLHQPYEKVKVKIDQLNHNKEQLVTDFQVSHCCASLAHTAHRATIQENIVKILE